MNPANPSEVGTASSQRPPARWRRRWRILVILLAIVTAAAAAIVIILPIVVERQLNVLAARYLAGLSVRFSGTQWVFPWQACLHGVRGQTTDRDAPVFSIDRVCVDLGSLWQASEHLTIHQVAIERGSVQLDRLLDSESLAVASQPTPETQAAQPQRPPIGIDNIMIDDVTVHTQRRTDPGPFDVRVVRGRLTHRQGGPWAYCVEDCRIEAPGGAVRVTGTVDMAELASSRLEATWRGFELDAGLVKTPPNVRSLTCTGQAKVYWDQPGQHGPQIALTADRLIAYPQAAQGESVVARDIGMLVQPSPEQPRCLRAVLERMQLSGGQVRGQLTYEPSAERPLQGRADLEAVRLEPIYRLLLPQNEPLRAVGSGSITFDAATLGEDWSAGGQLDLTEAELTRLPVIRAVLDHLRARKLVEKINPLAFRNARVQFRAAPEGIDLTQTEVRSPAVVLYFEGRVGWEQQLDLTVTAGTLPGLRKKLPDVIRVADEWLSRMLRENLVPLRVTGTMRKPIVVPLPGGKITERSAQFFGSLLRQAKGE
jgi:hypothetical protein